MIKTTIAGLLFSVSMVSHAAPSKELAYTLKASIAKIHSVNATGGKSTGTGVVVAENKVATNCHVLANSIGMDIGAMGEHYQPVGIQADWKHDICILNFQFLPLKAAPLGDSEHLQYEQEIFSIGFPGGPPKPLTTFGSIKALYPLDDSVVIRTSASFQMGASGSPLFNAQGEVIGLSTFKSPGRNGLFYNVPVQWVKSAMQLPVAEFGDHYQPAFWEEDLAQKPYWMQVVLPAQNEHWDEVEGIVKRWIVSSPYDTEARFYDAMTKAHTGRADEAKKIYQSILKQIPLHAGSLLSLAALAKSEGKEEELLRYQDQMAKLNIDPDEMELYSMGSKH